MKTYLSVTKALADESRTRILKLLETGELCVCQIQAVLGLGQSTVSKHLSVLKQAGLVEIRKDGIWIYHLLNPQPEGYALTFLASLKDWLNQDAQVLADRKKLVEVKAVELRDLCKK